MVATLVQKIIADIRAHGDAAVRAYTKKFDGIDSAPKSFFLPMSECEKAVDRIDPLLVHALKTAQENIRCFHKGQYRAIQRVRARANGCVVCEQITPVARAGVYVPGGKYPYPSSVLMNVVPAKVAGVKEVIVATPLKNLNDVVKAALHIAGADKVLCIGGAQAIAALAYGTKTIPKVDVIVGPGNSFVTEAKRQVFGDVGIDMLAGPSEVLVWADASCEPTIVAEDLMAQAEHGADSKAVLLAPSKTFVQRVQKFVGSEYRSRITYIVEKDQKKCIAHINAYAPEHMEVLAKVSDEVVEQIKNAGAIFVGKYTPVACGDYWLGPSHTLPTAGCARFASGLSVSTFLKRCAVMTVERGYLERHADEITVIANAEGMKHHAASVKQRIKKPLKT